MYLRGRFAVSVLACTVTATSLLAGCGGGSSQTTPAEDSGGPADTGVADSSGQDAADTGFIDLDTGTLETGTFETGVADAGVDGGPTGHTVVAPVAGGVTMTSSGHRLVTTTSQIPGSAALTSSSHQLRGGVVSIGQP